MERNIVCLSSRGQGTIAACEDEIGIHKCDRLLVVVNEVVIVAIFQDPCRFEELALSCLWPLQLWKVKLRW